MLLPARNSKAFTLLELIVVIVILGILAAIAIPTFQKVIGRSQDSSAESTLSTLHREASALAAFQGTGIFTASDVTGAGEDIAGAGWTMTADTAAAPAAATVQREVVFQLSPDLTRLGMATVSASGRCVTSVGAVSGNVVTTVHTSPAACDGDLALTGSTTAAPAPAPTVSYSTGALDATFGTGGKVVTPIGTGTDYAQSVVVQGDGKIVAAGYGHNGTNWDFALTRYNIDGTLDTTFGTSGKVVTPVGAGHDHAQSVVVQGDGKLVAAGYSHNGSNWDFALIRYNANGSLDTTFDGDGKVVTQVGASQDQAWSAALQDDGKIVVAGMSQNGTNADFALVRYNTNGSLDATFDGDGKALTPVGSSTDVAHAVTVQGDGKLVAAGSSYNGANDDFALVRYNADGSLDTMFDGDGKALTPVGAGTDVAHSVVLQGDGKLVAAGYGQNGTDWDFALARYNTDGTLDATFDGDGKVLTPVGAGEDRSYSVIVQGDGKLLAAGYSVSTTADFALARYNTDGTLDATFDGDGKVVTPIGAGHDTAYSVALQGDGKIVAAGRSHNGTNDDFALVRYN